MQDDWAKLVPILETVFEECPEPEDNKRRKQFQVARYVESVKQSSSVQYEGVFEMMDERTYNHAMAKPEKGSLEFVDSSIKWEELHSIKEPLPIT